MGIVLKRITSQRTVRLPFTPDTRQTLEHRCYPSFSIRSFFFFAGKALKVREIFVVLLHTCSRNCVFFAHACESLLIFSLSNQSINENNSLCNRLVVITGFKQDLKSSFQSMSMFRVWSRFITIPSSRIWYCLLSILNRCQTSKWQELRKEPKADDVESAHCNFRKKYDSCREFTNAQISRVTDWACSLTGVFTSPVFCSVSQQPLLADSESLGFWRVEIRNPYVSAATIRAVEYSRLL